MWRRLFDDERGAVLPAVALGLIAVLAMAGAGFGFGRLTLASTEAQTAADVAALSGAMGIFRGSDPEADAEAAMAPNKIETWSAATSLAELEVGYYDYDHREFNEGALPTNSVKARVLTTVNNGAAALLGKPTSVVEKIAYASFTGLRGGRPTLPIAIGDCHFEEDCFSDSCMPSLSQVPDTSDNSAWTGFFDGSSNNSVLKYFPSACGGVDRTDQIWIDDWINIGNGQVTPLLNAVDCLYSHGLTQHIIPIVKCNSTFNQQFQVTGFATIVIDNVIKSGGQKGIYLHAIFRSNATGALGGRSFGTGNIALVPVDSSDD